jgi:uncharacterized membrane-anchored protein YitT (DUF2179 family)
MDFLERLFGKTPGVSGQRGFRHDEREEEAIMKIIAGLGNPGTKYAGSRHNIGFAVTEALAERHNIRLTDGKFRGRYGTGIIGGVKVGKKFFVGSLLGLSSSTVALELLAKLPAPETEPLLACVYGGALVGVGLGIVVMAGASTGGSDIIVRLLKRKWRNVPIGTITMGFDIVVTVLTGLAFGDMRNALYTGLTVFISGKVMDVVIYSFDYSKVAIIISDKYEEISDWIIHKLVRGVTYLRGEGAYSRTNKNVILTVVKSHQLAELKQKVVDVDPDAFVILQEAHQVLGDVTDAQLRGRRLVAELRFGDRVEGLGNVPLQAQRAVAEYCRDRIRWWCPRRLLSRETHR